VGAGSHNPNTTALNHPYSYSPPHSLPSVVPKTCDVQPHVQFSKNGDTQPHVLAYSPPLLLPSRYSENMLDANSVFFLYIIPSSLPSLPKTFQHSFHFGYIIETRILGLVVGERKRLG
jgi:hypothetical protein